LVLGPRLRGDERRVRRVNISGLKRREGNSSLAPVSLPGAGIRPYSLLFASPEMRGMARRRGAWPGFRQTGPIVSRASPERRALALLRGAPAPLGAPPRHLSAFALYGGRTCAGPVVPRHGYPTAARVRDCEPRTRVPRPAPLRTTPRPKRPSVDGTAITYSDCHPECQWGQLQYSLPRAGRAYHLASRQPSPLSRAGAISTLLLTSTLLWTSLYL
jgi:hypothetical protein